MICPEFVEELSLGVPVAPSPTFIRAFFEPAVVTWSNDRTDASEKVVNPSCEAAIEDGPRREVGRSLSHDIRWQLNEDYSLAALLAFPDSLAVYFQEGFEASSVSTGSSRS
ncbi:hypothetical protein AG1IA_04799 [Rhizoctonia solani AG-1 IA]|uniref:Uncharacterized protein n=1 Tax=Thanatephorus cucumeris (strain AG1-IA) TaxID=983506 RepID=L8WSP8_THACA|nr:hypothetical protein AG1IA_04799 [Rhizoctonia solani AG-1 IA]